MTLAVPSSPRARDTGSAVTVMPLILSAEVASAMSSVSTPVGGTESGTRIVA